MIPQVSLGNSRLTKKNLEGLKHLAKVYEQGGRVLSGIQIIVDTVTNTSRLDGDIRFRMSPVKIRKRIPVIPKDKFDGTYMVFILDNNNQAG